MSQSDESDWSESEDGLDQLQTSVLLGLPDGEILDPKDLRDPNVSRLGGKPVRPCDCSPWVHTVCTYTRLGFFLYMYRYRFQCALHSKQHYVSGWGPVLYSGGEASACRLSCVQSMWKSMRSAAAHLVPV